MNVTILYPDIMRGASWTGSYSTGIGSLSSILKQARHRVSLVHVKKPITIEHLVSRVEKEKPDLLAFSTTTAHFSLIREWSTKIRERINVPTICGGVHATLSPEETLSVEGIDMVCEGEGEETLLEVCERLDKNSDLEGIRGLWVKRKDEVLKGLPRALLKDLDRLPPPDRSVYDYPSLNLVNQGKGIVMASRGCPYHCTYCCNHALKKRAGNGSPYVRFRSVNGVIDEIKKLLRDYSFLNAIHFEDDILPLKRVWFDAFFQQYKKEIGLPFSCNIRPNLLTEPVARLLKESNCSLLQMGIESGNDFIREKILKRSLKKEKLIHAFELCKTNGIKTMAFNIVGIPFETPRRILDTIKLNAKVVPDLITCSIAVPYPLTELYEICKTNRFLSERCVTDYYSTSSLNLPGLSNERITFFRIYFKVVVRMYRAFLKFPAIPQRIGIGMLDQILCTRVNLNPMYRSMNVVYRLFETTSKFARNIIRSKRIRSQTEKAELLSMAKKGLARQILAPNNVFLPEEIVLANAIVPTPVSPLVK